MIKVARFIESFGGGAGKVPPRWLVISGAEEFLRAEARETAIKAMGEDIDVFEYDWEAEASRDEGALGFFDELRTASLFGTPKVVIVRKAQKFVKDHGKALARFAAQEEPQVWVILEDEALVAKRARKLTKPLQALVDAGGEIVDCSALYASPFGFDKPVWDSDLSRWVVARARARGRRMSLQAAWLLHSRETSGLRGVAAQLDKIILNLGEATEIRQEDVEKLVGGDAEASLFEVVDHFGRADLRRTLSAVDRLFRQGVKDARGKRSQDPTDIAMRLMSMISTRMRELGRIMELSRDGLGFEEACGQVIGSGRRFLFPRMKQQLEARSAKDLGQCVVDLGRLDLALKSGGGHPRDLLVFFLLRHLRRDKRPGTAMRKGLTA